ncbi:MAG: DUF6600 domain-containing protein [Thermoanaerobaculia bacterium]
MVHQRPRPFACWFLTLLALVAAVLSARPLSAQREGYSYLSYVGNEVSLVSKSEEDSTARINMPIGPGDKLTTGRSSRAEAILADGNVVRFDSRTEVRFDRLAQTHEADDDRDLIALQTGSLSVEVRSRIEEDRAIRIDTDDATVVLSERGLFRIDVGRQGTEVYAVSGSAMVLARGGQATVNEGEYAVASGSATIEVETAELPNDRFTRFVEERRVHPRRDREERGARYVAEAGAADYDYDYETSGMDDNGSWTFVASLDRYCWRPRVGSDWRPYSLGYWRSSPCGLTWVSYEPWGWLPYHYGTWSFASDFGWCWMPGAQYSPAWVYWNYTSSHLGWCPVGYYGYYDNYYRSTRSWFGDGRGLSYPHLRGAVDVTQVNQGGWNYAQIPTVGSRFSPRDVIRGDRVTFRPGEIGVIATAPLRFERASQGRLAIQEAVRRVPVSEGLGTGARSALPVNSGLTSILRRSENLTPAGRAELRRSVVQVGRDPGYRPLAPEQVLSGRRIDISNSGGTTPVRGDPDRRRSASGSGSPDSGSPGGAVSRIEPVTPRSSWRDAPRRVESAPGMESPARRDGSSSPRPQDSARPSPRADEGWRSRGSSSSPRAAEAPREERTAPRREDGGWRSPRADSPRAETPRPREAREDSSRREAPAPRSESRPEPRSEPRREAAPPSPRSESPRESPRHESPAPRSEPAPQQRSEPAPQPRSQPPADQPSRRSSSFSRSFDSGNEPSWRTRSSAGRVGPSYQARAERNDSQASAERIYRPIPSRPYDSVRSSTPSAREYQSPVRSYEPSRFSAPSPRAYQAPSSSSYEASRSNAPSPRAYQSSVQSQPSSQPRVESRPAPQPAQAQAQPQADGRSRRF